MAAYAGNISHGDLLERAGLKAFLKAAILLGLGFYFADMVFSDKLKNYSNQPEWLTLTAASLFALLGVASIANFVMARSRAGDLIYRETEEHHDHSHGHEYAHDHRYTSWVVVVIVAIPRLMG